MTPAAPTGGQRRPEKAARKMIGEKGSQAKSVKSFYLWA